MPIQPKYFQIAMSPAQAHRKPHPKNPKAILRLEFRDLSEEGAAIFLKQLDCAAVLSEAVNGVLNILYLPQGEIPPTRSITLILRSMGGVAYTTGLDIDGDHKEIHVSTDYIASIAKDRRKEEMLGVLRHEMVHCWQWNAFGTAPGGLIEGVADWVRLRSDLAPPHWSKDGDGDWDAGYEHTGFLLQYLEERFGDGSIPALNQKLQREKYDEEKFWKQLFGHPIEQLWKDYGKSLKKKHDHNESKDENETSNLQRSTENEAPNEKND